MTLSICIQSFSILKSLKAFGFRNGMRISLSFSLAHKKKNIRESVFHCSIAMRMLDGLETKHDLIRHLHLKWSDFFFVPFFCSRFVAIVFSLMFKHSLLQFTSSARDSEKKQLNLCIAPRIGCPCSLC